MRDLIEFRVRKSVLEKVFCELRGKLFGIYLGRYVCVLFVKKMGNILVIVNIY